MHQVLEGDVARLRRANASLSEDLQRAHRRADRLARRAAAGACTYAAGTLPWRSEGRRQAGCAQACSGPGRTGSGVRDGVLLEQLAAAEAPAGAVRVLRNGGRACWARGGSNVGEGGLQ